MSYAYFIFTYIEQYTLFHMSFLLQFVFLELCET